MTTAMKRCVIAGFLLAVAAASATGRVEGEDLIVGRCMVRSFADDFTDALHSVILECTSETRGGAARAVVWFESGNLAFEFFDKEREYDIPSNGENVSVAIRVDQHPAVELSGKWFTRDKLARTEFANSINYNVLGDAEAMIYRIGPNGVVHRIVLPDELAMAAEEFGKRIESRS